MSLNLIKDYFINRKQATKLNGNLSGFEDIQLGVSQGSVLGPLLFKILSMI
jgi:hypothetical protein